MKEDTIDEGANRRAQYKQHGPDKNKDDVRRLGSETQEMNETRERNRREGVFVWFYGWKLSPALPQPNLSPGAVKT